MKLSCISLAMLPLLSVFSVQAAVYNVVEVGQVDELKSTFAAGINNAGDTVFNGAILTTSSAGQAGMQFYNFPIDLSLIDFENETVQSWFTEQQLNDLLNGQIANDTLAILLSRNPAGQRFGGSTSFSKRSDGVAQNLLLRDIDAQRGNNEYLFAINDAGVAVGHASSRSIYQSFTPAPTTTVPEPVATNEWVPELPLMSAVVYNNTSVTTLAAPYTAMGGGITAAYSINQQNVVAGYGSVGLVTEAITSLETRCNGNTVPVDRCLFTHHTATANQPGEFSQELANFTYSQRAMLWQLDANGAVIGEPTVFGFLGDKNSQAAHSLEGVKPINYYSKAFDVNDAGIAVGLSLYSNSDRKLSTDQIYRSEQATIFVDDEVTAIVDVNEWDTSKAVAINNNNVVIGSANRMINGAMRTRFFYHDYNTAETRFVNGFFNSSSTYAKAINDNEQVVGNAEVIIAGTITRRKHGFMYDIAADSFTDLNTLIGCSSSYTIVDATDINNNGVITATALTQRESKNLLGESVLDAQGNPVMENVTTVVMLQPIANGEVDNCNNDDSGYQRSGGSIGFGWLLLAAMGLMRRRR